MVVSLINSRLENNTLACLRVRLAADASFEYIVRLDCQLAHTLWSPGSREEEIRPSIGLMRQVRRITDASGNSSLGRSGSHNVSQAGNRVSRCIRSWRRGQPTAEAGKVIFPDGC